MILRLCCFLHFEKKKFIACNRNDRQDRLMDFCVYHAVCLPFSSCINAVLSKVLSIVSSVVYHMFLCYPILLLNFKYIILRALLTGLMPFDRCFLFHFIITKQVDFRNILKHQPLLCLMTCQKEH